VTLCALEILLFTITDRVEIRATRLHEILNTRNVLHGIVNKLNCPGSVSQFRTKHFVTVVAAGRRSIHPGEWSG